MDHQDLKVGVFGHGHLGKIHLKCLEQTPFKVVGIYDPAYVRQEMYNDIPFYENEDALIQSCDACIIASTTSTHFELADKAVRNKKHIFVEKPMTSTVDEAQKLKAICDVHPDIVSQIGFVERYNPAYKFVNQKISDPKFIEVHRLATFNPRGADVSVIFDLMIHDIDLTLSMMKSEIREVKAHGVKLITDHLDICNARLEFNNNTVVNLTSSRMSMKSMRKFRIFQEGAYLSMDLDKKQAELIEIKKEGSANDMKISMNGKDKYFSFSSSGDLNGNAIVDELNDFYNCIVNNKQAVINCASALKTSELADLIEKTAIESSSI